MEKTTVLARLRFAMSFNEEAQACLHRVSNHDIWFADEGGAHSFRSSGTDGGAYLTRALTPRWSATFAI